MFPEHVKPAGNFARGGAGRTTRGFACGKEGRGGMNSLTAQDEKWRWSAALVLVMRLTRRRE